MAEVSQHQPGGSEGEAGSAARAQSTGAVPPLTNPYLAYADLARLVAEPDPGEGWIRTLGARFADLAELADWDGIVEVYTHCRRFLVPSAREALSPAHRELLLQVARAQILSARGDQAEAILRGLQEQPSPPPSATRLLASVLWLTRPGEALELLRRARQQPEDAHDLALLLTLLELLWERGALAEARDELARFAAHTDAPGLHLARANLEPATIRKLAGLNDYLQAFDLSPLSLRPDATLLRPQALAFQARSLRERGPLISVLMVTHNSASTVRAAVHSILAQTYRHNELWIVDDASTDETPELLGAMARGNPRIHVIQRRTSAGRFVALNQALAACGGALVTCQESDAVSHPQRLGLQFLDLQDKPERLATQALRLNLNEAGHFCLNAEGRFPDADPASLMFRRAPVLESVGSFDPVRLGAEAEFRARLIARHGVDAVGVLAVPLVLGRARAILEAEPDEALKAEPDEALEAGEDAAGLGEDDARPPAGALAPALRSYAGAWLDWHAAHVQDPQALYRAPNIEPRPFPIPGILRPVPVREAVRPPSLARLAMGPQLEVLHIADLTAGKLLSLALRDQVAIERSHGRATLVWNLLQAPAASFARQCRALYGQDPEAFVTEPPPHVRLAIIYDLEVLTLLSQREGGLAPADAVVVLTDGEVAHKKAQALLQRLGWHGAAYEVNPLLFWQRDNPLVPLWDLALAPVPAGTEEGPGEPAIGLSFMGRAPGAADLALVARLRRKSGLPVVVLVGEAHVQGVVAGLADKGVEVVPVRRSGDFWREFFARASVFLETSGDPRQTLFLGAVGEALRRGRAVLAVGLEEVETAGIIRFADEAALISLLRSLRTTSVLRDLVAQSQADIDARLGAHWHLHRLEGLLEARETLGAAAQLESERIADYLSAAPTAHALAWLERNPPLPVVQEVLRALGKGHSVRLVDLHEAVERREAAAPGAVREDLRFWLGLQSAQALSNMNMRHKAWQLMEQLDDMAYRKRLDPRRDAHFRERMALLASKAGQLESAIASLTRLSEEHPDNWFLLLQLGLYLGIHDPQQALAVLQRSAARAPQPRPIQLVFELAKAFNALGQYDAAIEVLETALAVRPDIVSLRLTLANARLGRGDRAGWARELLAVLPRSAGRLAVAIRTDSALPILEALAPAPLEPEPVSEASPLVTVIMTAYNAQESIAHAIRSVLAQSYPRLRLVVVDDLSTDGTLDEVLAVAVEDPRILVLPLQENVGTYGAKNRALSLVASDYYALHDSDDWMHPCRIARHLTFMSTHPHVVCSYSHWIRLDAAGHVTRMPHENAASSFFRRSLLDEFGYFDMARASSDGEFRWRLRRRYGRKAVPVIPEILTIGTQREGSLTTSGETALDPFGYNAVRVAYSESWLRWHKSVASPAELFMPYPLEARPFEAPADIDQPVAPLPHPFAHRPAEAVPPADAIVVQWPLADGRGRNWGGKLNPQIVTQISGRAVIHAQDPKRPPEAPVHLVVGSTLADLAPESIVWGAGLPRADTELPVKPARICAVRGPLSRQRLLAMGLECPEVFGDPALLYPLFYRPKVTPRFDVGLIQSHREVGQLPLPLLPRGLSVRLIDINGAIEEMIDAILSCRLILSSSLYGLIAAHAYGVPASWFKIQDAIKVQDGPDEGDFKFQDYGAAIGRSGLAPLICRPGETLDPSQAVATPGTPVVDLYRLLRACPFIEADRGEALIARAEAIRGDLPALSLLNCHAGLQPADGS